MFVKGTTVQIKVARIIASWACALGLVLPLSGGIAQAQTAPPAPVGAASVTTSVAPGASQGAADAAAPKKAAEVSDNPYGIEALWKTSDAVAKTVLMLLLMMSVSSWYVLIVKLFEQSKISRQGKIAAKEFWSAGTVQQGCAKLDANSPFRFIAEAGLDATKKHDGLMGHVDLNDWVAMSVGRAVERIQASMQSGLSVLATVGSISPFVGLFGNVWGIYHALTAIGISGQASLDKVAGPVGEALIMTAIGLAVAVPAVLAYNWLVGRNKNAMSDVRAFGADLHAVILGSVKKV